MKCLQKSSFELGGLSRDPKAERVGPGDRQGPECHARRWESFPKCLPRLGSGFPEPRSLQHRGSGDPRGDAVTARPRVGAGSTAAGWQCEEGAKYLSWFCLLEQSGAHLCSSLWARTNYNFNYVDTTPTPPLRSGSVCKMR